MFLIGSNCSCVQASLNLTISILCVICDTVPILVMFACDTILILVLFACDTVLILVMRVDSVC
jgi:hypothetical protein